MKTLSNQQNSVKSSALFQGQSLDTLAQPVTQPSEPPIDGDLQIVSQEGICPSTLLKRARAKYLTNAIVFRLADLDSPLNKAYWNSFHCASSLVLEDGKLTGRYCKNRWCMVCNRIRTAQLIHTYSPVLDEWTHKHFLTLTVPNVKAHELGLTIKIMNNAFRQIQNNLKKRTSRAVSLFPKIKGFRKLECTYNPVRDDYHPHFHIILDSEFGAIDIKEMWLKKFPICADIAQHISRADDNTCIELFKYFTKVLTKTTNEKNEKKYSICPQVLDTIFKSIKGIRTFQTFGFTLEKSDEPEIENIEKDEKMVAFLDRTVYGWLQEFSDWVDVKTGEVLTGYEPTAKMLKLTGDDHE